MKKIQLGTSDQKAAAVILGCMRINNAEDPVKVIETAYENGIDFFRVVCDCINDFSVLKCQNNFFVYKPLILIWRVVRKYPVD